MERMKRVWTPVVKRLTPVGLWGVTVVAGLWWMVQPSADTVYKKVVLGKE
jgi:hypothetical protein